LASGAQLEARVSSWGQDEKSKHCRVKNLV